MTDPGWLQTAKDNLAAGQLLLAAGFEAAAGRLAYTVVFQATQALLLARTGTTPKTHAGTRAELHRLTLSEPRLERWHTSLLARTYELKDFADYGRAVPAGSGEAVMALAESDRFIGDVERLLRSDQQSAPVVPGVPRA